MLFNSADRNLYIFGGQRKHDEYVNDFFTFNVDTETVTVISDGVISRYYLSSLFISYLSFISNDFFTFNV